MTTPIDARSLPIRLFERATALFEAIPHSLIALIARFSIAAVFWKSGQTKVEGFAVDLIDEIGRAHV